MKYHWKIWIGKKPKCEYSTIDVTQVDWVHFSSAVYMLFVGIQISISILLGEMFVNYIYTRSIKRRELVKVKMNYW